MAAASQAWVDLRRPHLLDEGAGDVFIIAATFADDGALDLDSLARLIDFYLGAGVHGLIVLGMMGKPCKLTYEVLPRGRARAARRRGARSWSR